MQKILIVDDKDEGILTEGYICKAGIDYMKEILIPLCSVKSRSRR